MNRYLLSPAAQSDLSDIWDFTADRWGADQAERYILRLRVALADLVAGRRQSRSADDVLPGYRTCLVGSHAIYFVVTEADLIVVRVLHQSMDPENHLRG